MNRKKWTMAELQTEALKYNYRADFKRGASGAYSAALKMKVKDEICQHMGDGTVYWTEDKIRKNADNYSGKTDFFKRSINAYRAAYKMGILDSLFKKTALQTARERGDVMYYTGIPCPKGHISKRYTASRGCVACLREREQRLEIKAVRKQYFDGRKLDKRLYDTSTAIHRKDLAKTADGSITPDSLLDLFRRQKGQCGYCLCLISLDDKNGTHLDHIIPENKNGKHILSNVVWSCRSCNSRKKDNIWTPEIDI